MRPWLLLGEIRMRAYIGAVYKDMGNYTEALKYLIPALERYLEVKNNARLFEVYTSLGTIYYRQAGEADSSEAKKKYTEAIDYLHKGLNVPKAKGIILNLDVPLEAYLSLSKSYKGIGDSKNALYYLNLYLELKDSLYNADLYRKISVVNTQHELEKVQIEEKARQDLLLANEKSINERDLADQKLQQERILADERVANEKKIAAQKLEQEKAIAKANSEKSIAIQKIRNEKQQTNNLLLMGLILAVMASVFLFFYLRQRNEKKRAVEKAAAIHKMAELEMQSLRSQLNPHFMFNSLNSLQTLILTEESDKSQSYLAQFSKMLRMLLENADKPFIPLQKEIDFLQLYLGLEEMRVPDLQYSISTDPTLDTEQTLIPNMILQPYVENAIWHGLSHKESDKQVKIRIYRENGTVNCEVEDNGIGRKKAEELKSLFRKQHKSKGMELLTKRFKLLNEEYGSNIEAIVTDMKKDDKDSGTLVTIKIPVMQSA